MAPPAFASRRSFLSSLGATAIASSQGTLAFSGGMHLMRHGSNSEGGSLAAAAKARGRYFGTAVRIDQLDAETGLRDIVVQNCDRITPEIHLKWDSIEWKRGAYNFAPADDLLAFASASGIGVRGHTLIWDRSTPAWAKRDIATHRDWETVAAYFRLVLSRYRDRIDEWDVLNEVVDTEAGDGDLRRTVFQRAFGSGYMERALHEARAHAPSARLAINDYGFEYGNETETARRIAFVALLRRLTKSGVPIDGVGIQAHLDLSKGPLQTAAIRDFLRSITDLGLQIAITELDVKEADVRAPLNVRDVRVADHAARYLEIALSATEVRGVTTWGISDKHSWLSGASASAEAINRGVPYDQALCPKRMYSEIARVLAGT